jgi:hypothetical protein
MTTKTLIINPPFLEPHRPPISCAIIAEIAHLAGHHVQVMDINIDFFNSVGHDRFLQYQTDYLFNNEVSTISKLNEFVYDQLTVELLCEFDWILVSCFSTWEWPMTELILLHCKKTSSAKIVVGGPGISGKSNYLLSNGIVDYCVDGEGEIVLDQLFRGNDQYPGINGIPPQQIDDLNDLPLPNYDFFDLKKYDWLLDSPDVFIYGSRGCVRKCTFCDVASYWPKYRYRSGASIAEEMIRNYEKFGIKNFYFADSLLNGSLKEFRVFLDQLSKFGPAQDFNWGGYAIIRPKNQHPAELFDQIKAAGGHFFSIGVETGVDRIRLEMKKNFSNDDIDWHLEQSQRIKLQNIFLMITSWHSETQAEHEEYLKIFPRWQRYAVDGTIFGLSINPPLALLPNTPNQRLLDEKILIKESFAKLSPVLKDIAWINPAMPELSFKERYRRTLAITQEAVKYNWNITNKQTKLNEIKQALTSYIQASQCTIKSPG